MHKLITHVDPFIGVDGPGECLCGPYLPHGLVRLGPDTLPPHKTSGYDSNAPIIRFSHTHVNGTGGMSRYGNVGVTPFIGPARFQVEAYDRAEEKAEPGYYAVRLLPADIDVELTCTERTGFHRYRFPASSEAALLIDAGAVIQPLLAPNDGNGFMPESTGGFVERLSDYEVTGRGDFRGGWGHNYPYSVYFYARLNTPIQSSRATDGAGVVSLNSIVGRGAKIILGLGKVREIQLQVGISFVSVAKARASVEREIGPKSFDEVKSLAQEKWEAMLSRIQVAGGTEEQLKLFYSLFSRLLCMPTDLGCDDEFGSWHSGVRHFTDFCCVWDNVRTACALTALFDPSKHIDQLNCLLDVAEKTGWLPDVWIAGHSACVQGGSSADILFCEAAGKELPGIDYEKALRYMRKNNEVDPPDPYFYGRYLKDYHELGYVSTDVRLSCVSRHLEYAYQDWCIGALAEKLGHLELARQYRENSRKVWNLWREDIRQFAPRVRGGDWVQPFDPAYHLPDRWNDPYFYEGNSWQWSFNVHHDFAGLVQRHGSAEGFCRHLDAFFDGGLYESKETMLHVPYLYHYAGRPDRTAQRVRKVREAYFAPTRNGLKDNEDMGCQSSFYIWSSIGVFPIMGQDIYLLNSPVFEETVIRMGESGKSIKIKAEFESPNARYVAAVQVNGKSQDRSWIRHAEIAGGGEISFRVSDQPGEWGRHDVPPSPMSSTA